eukprot:1691594-Lingulodinium_polyedra.AAC.1
MRGQRKGNAKAWGMHMQFHMQIQTQNGNAGANEFARACKFTRACVWTSKCARNARPYTTEQVHS